MTLSIWRNLRMTTELQNEVSQRREVRELAMHVLLPFAGNVLIWTLGGWTEAVSLNANEWCHLALLGWMKRKRQLHASVLTWPYAKPTLHDSPCYSSAGHRQENILYLQETSSSTLQWKQETRSTDENRFEFAKKMDIFLQQAWAKFLNNHSDKELVFDSIYHLNNAHT